MSLFKAREFWTTTCEDLETFDQYSLLVTSLNSESDFIITASQNGTLRIFRPNNTTENAFTYGYRPSDLILEKVFSPIIQVNTGRLVSCSQNRQLAILHPRVLSIYSLIVKEGATDHGTQHILQLMYEHNLRRSAANMLIGSFGGAKNREFTCVQSLDGLLTFYEQETFSFCCFLDNFLLPEPIVYNSRFDTFLTCNSNWQIESYSFKKLSEAGQNSDENDNLGRKVQSDWSFNLSEGVMDMAVVDVVGKEYLLCILGERNYYCLNEGGQLKFMKRLDFSPVCFYTYCLDDKVIALIVAETSTLLIYQNTSLKWSAQLQILPISIRRAFLKTIPGALVLLTEEGTLQCCYLGTEPSIFVAPPINFSELDFEKAEVELATLNKIIKSTYSSDTPITSSSLEKQLTVNTLVNPELQTCKFESNIKTAINNQMCQVTIDLIPQTQFEEVQITMHVHRPLKVVPQIEFHNNLKDKTTITSFVYLNEALDIVSLEMTVIATFISSLGVPRTITKMLMLPLNLVLENCPTQKENGHKITLNINQSPVTLHLLFPGTCLVCLGVAAALAAMIRSQILEFQNESISSDSGNVLGFKNVTNEGKPVSILMAKSSERYRLQSDSLASLNLLVEQLCHRLKKHYTSEDFSITFASSLPVNEIFPYIERHYQTRQTVIFLQNKISQLSSQYRLIEKRLISKFKVKNPTPLTNLELLLDDTFEEIMEASDRLFEETEKLDLHQTELEAVVNLLRKLISETEVHKDNLSLIKSVFINAVYDVDGQNWVDVFETSLCFLLRTILAKSEKDKLRAPQTSFDEVKDLSKLEKHLSQVAERISKKLPLQQTRLEEEASNDQITPLETVPIGRKLGESSGRLLSARKSRSAKINKAEEQMNSLST